MPVIVADVEVAHGGLELGDDRHYLVDDGRLLQGGDLQAGLETAGGRIAAPAHLLDTVRIAFQQSCRIRTAHAVNLDAFGPGHEAEDIVPEHGVAAFGHSVIQVFDVVGIDYKYVVAA